MLVRTGGRLGPEDALGHYGGQQEQERSHEVRSVTRSDFSQWHGRNRHMTSQL
jgi:hypothetical protein